MFNSANSSLYGLPDINGEMEKLRFAIAASGIGTWELDLEHKIVYWDQRCKELYGVPSDAVLHYDHLPDLIHPDDRRKVEHAFQEAIDCKTKSAYDVRFRTLPKTDKRVKWLRCKGSAAFNEAGIAYRISGVAMNISEEVATLEAANAAKGLADHAISSSGIGMFHFDLRTGKTEYSPAFARILTGDHTREGLTRKDFISRVHPDDESLRQTMLRVAYQTGEINYQPRVVWDDGSVHRIHVMGACSWDAFGKPVSLSGTVIDTSEQDRQARALKEAEDRFRLMVEQAPVAMLVLHGDDMIFETVNKPMLEILAKNESIVGQPLLQGVPELEGQAIVDILYDVYSTGEPYTGYDILVKVQREGRLEERFFTFNYTPIKENERVTGVMQIATDVTKQVRARQQLEESEARFRGLIEEAPVATCLFVGTQHRVELANAKMLAMWGKGKEALSRPLAEAVPELVGQPFLDILDHVYTTGNTYSAYGAKADLKVDGELRTFYFDFTYKPLRNANGNIYGIMDMAVEVTDQVLARQRLEESELFSRSVFENSPVAKMVFVGEEMVIKSINENMLALLGRDSSILTKTLLEAVPEVASPELLASLREVLLTGVTYHGNEERFEINRFGVPHTGYYNYIFKALPKPNGDYYGVMVTATEVTNQVMAREQIREAEETLRRAIELAELGTWNIDLATRTVEYSPRLRKWFGFDEADEVTIAKAYASVLPGHRARVKEAMRSAIDPKIRSLYDVEYSVVNKRTGMERILHAQGKAFFDDAGKAYKVTGTAQDVTKQRQLQLALEQEVQQRTLELKNVNAELLATNEELFKLNEQLVHSNEELAQYAYVASHDLQEPLRKIRLFSELLESASQSPEKNKHFINKIIQSSERMSMLIRDLLEFSRLLKSDRLMRPVDLSKLAEAVVSDFELTINEKNAEIIIGELPEIEAVGLQMNQLFYNLLGNALKFTDPSTRPKISISAAAIDQETVERFLVKPFEFSNYYEIVFADNGIGFEPQYAEQIFEVFKRLHGREVYPGSGIGLALCRRIVSNHHGYMYANSTPGEGTSFHVILPGKQQNTQSSLPDNFRWAGTTN